MSNLKGQRILLGITGGIAAYKTPILVRQLCDAGAQVQVVMSEGAHNFVTGTTLSAVSGTAVRSDTFDEAAEAAMGHIELARWADAVLIAPVTAHYMAKLAHGLADDLLSTLCLATPAPLLLAPAMNQAMWRNPATQANAETLRLRGLTLLGPAEGDQACGDTGPGRMLEPEELTRALHAHFAPKPMSGRRIVITAGPTQEAIDPVRYISNHSSGKQGFAIAEAAAAAGADVVLVAGPTALTTPPGVSRVNVRSAAEMHAAVFDALPQTDIFIGVAAVADFRAADIPIEKIKREGRKEMSVALTANPDIIADVASSAQRPPLVVGFAAETNNVLEHARGKRLRKRIDVIVVNDVSDQSIGFNSDANSVTIISEHGEVNVLRQSKAAVAVQLLSTLDELFVRQLAHTNPVSA